MPALLSKCQFSAKDITLFSCFFVLFYPVFLCYLLEGGQGADQLFTAGAVGDAHVSANAEIVAWDDQHLVRLGSLVKLVCVAAWRLYEKIERLEGFPMAPRNRLTWSAQSVHRPLPGVLPEPA